MGIGWWYRKGETIQQGDLSTEVAPTVLERKTSPLITAIIPAYNEAARIPRVLEALRSVPALSEIIVVDDGSDDATQAVVQQARDRDARIRVCRHEKNLGKGQAIFSGWGCTQATILLLLDADLMGLESYHVELLMQPVIEGRADMAIGQFRGGYWRTDLGHWATPWLSGQRCLRADLLRSVSKQAAAGYGVETALTVASHTYKWRCMRIPLAGVWHLPSENRRGVWRGFKTRMKMYGQIINAWYLSSGLGFGRREKVRSFAQDESSEP